jgi:hypothetical protein
MQHDKARPSAAPIRKEDMIAEANKTRQQLEGLLNEVLKLILQTKQLAAELAEKCDAAQRDKPRAAS